MTLRSMTTGLVSGLALFSLSQAAAFATDPVDPQQNTTITTSSGPKLRLPLLGTLDPLASEAQNDEAIAEGAATPGILTEPVEQPDILAQKAVAYGSYQADVSSFKKTLESTADIEAAMSTLGTHNARQLANGWLSYSALLAAESKEFQEGVIYADSYFGRERLLLGMQNSPAYTLSITGAPDAVSRALGAGKADARRLDAIGEQIKEQAYSLQSLGWAKAKLPGKPTDHATKLRLAALNGRPQSGAMRTLFTGPDFGSTVTRANSLGGVSSLWDSVSQIGTELRLPVVNAMGYQRRYVVRPGREATGGSIATLAALKILGQTEVETVNVTSALNDPQTQGCFEQAQLNLLQCVSASRNVFERPFCIGVHALKDVGSCVGDVSQ